MLICITFFRPSFFFKSLGQKRPMVIVNKDKSQMLHIHVSKGDFNKHNFADITSKHTESLNGDNNNQKSAVKKDKTVTENTDTESSQNNNVSETVNEFLIEPLESEDQNISATDGEQKVQHPYSDNYQSDNDDLKNIIYSDSEERRRYPLNGPQKGQIDDSHHNHEHSDHHHEEQDHPYSDHQHEQIEKLDQEQEHLDVDKTPLKDETVISIGNGNYHLKVVAKDRFVEATSVFWFDKDQAIYVADAYGGNIHRLVL